MSKKETQNADQAPEKVMTKYDLKMQRRKEEKERAEKSRRRDNILGVVIVAALVCLVASFPIRNYLTVHGSYVKVNGEDVSKVEFDYNYNVAVSNYLSQYAYYLYMMGIDPTSDFTSQMYSDTLTWGDYFQQMAVENMIRNKSLLAAAKAEGFAYDTAEDVQGVPGESGFREQHHGEELPEGAVRPLCHGVQAEALCGGGSVPGGVL